MDDQNIQLESARADMTPYYMAKMSCDIFDVTSAKATETKRPWYKYFLYCVVIELGLNATLLNNNNTQEQKNRNKKVRHNLTELRKQVAGHLPDDFFKSEDVKAVDQISIFFKGKSLEYVSADLLEQMVTVGKKLPDVTALEAVAKKVVSYLNDQKCFIHSDTPS